MSQLPAPARSPHGHPPGLYLLFTAEMWERLSYYGMRALLVLYIVDKARGLGWSKDLALTIYGWYGMLVYLTPLLGGYLADRYLGQRKSVLMGGVLMMMGQFVLSLPGVPMFYAGLGLLIAGNGLFKPNISTMVGGLYKEGDARRDGAFTIFYMGINLGAMLAPLVCGTIGEKIGWSWGYRSAGIGMGLGVLSFLFLAQRFLGDLGREPSARVAAAARAAAAKDGGAHEDKPLTTEETDRIKVIVILAIFVIIFWAAFEQAGGLMNLYTDEKVDRVVFGWTVPTTWFQAVNPVFILGLGPLFSMLWTSLGEKGKDPSIPVKMGMGLLLLSTGFLFMLGASSQSAAGGKAALFWVIAAYFLHTTGELCLSPIGLSMVTKLAPKKYASLLMGCWFLSNAIANKLAGTIGTYAEKLGEFTLFAAIVGVTACTGLVLISVAKPLRAMMHGADAIKAPQPHAEEKPAEGQ